MSAELGKMLKCLTHRTYRSLQEDNYTPVNHAIKSEEPIKKSGSRSHSEPASTLGSPQRTGGLHGLKSAIGLRLRGLRSEPKRAAAANDECASCGGDASAAPRYTRLPAATKSRVASALQLLRRHKGAAKLLRERSKSDNSLQRLSVVHGATSRSDHALQRLLVRNSSEQHVFLPPHSPPAPIPDSKKSARRSRSLERTSNFRVYPVNSGTVVVSSNGSRSLERNHKFRIGRTSPPAAAAPTTETSLCSARHAFPHCASCPLAAHNQEGLRAFAGSTVLLLQRPSMAAPPPPEPHRGALVSRPDNGWLHSEHKLAREGISYLVKGASRIDLRYVGCLEVKTSMKSLDFETRSMIAKECINRVCEAAGLKTVDKKRKVERRVGRVLADHPNMNHAGANVTLSISSKGLQLTVLDTGQMIAQHDMPNISFASGGDPDTLDFMAYVAKDANQWRACMVLECGGGMAQDVITTVG
ncbi:SHC-transforming protein 4-like isoform X1 [Neocloeon triangulifer]|uniref:SHC-transforming protein 4-like isoform X1 n=1 Tax=Neocloeon triangulifer TaxID=2078957 RepID=UPI00286ED03A|nr:SHC-transforming protein 4-like isoform X1 [Neocloeon triangulifer]XP_059474708.1 SHC-transforming protein 4-like isoform X1 [Neocloeon triangulifer]XP_059474709.1 SHC-transforming protein 4-like isoform X1 [Neocloeon triangulifer]XP_059474710.1 SHC-transforming protein 4-like isoform X1 [Neocloeon triangulifer]